MSSAHSLSRQGDVVDAKLQRRPGRRAVYAGIDGEVVGSHGEAVRPLCLCVPGGVPMYVARHGDGRLVKRMPLSGFEHAPWCPHYGPPSTHRADGRQATDGPHDATPPRPPPPAVTLERKASAQAPADDACQVRLAAMLRDLWTRAELNRWHPGFAGKRHWGIVRRHLLQAASQVRTPAGAVAKRLYVPEVFSVERADRIRERREARWNWIVREGGDTLPSMVVVGELKALRPGQRFARAWLKHVPDCPFLLRGSGLRQIEQRYDAELAWWGRNGGLHMVCIATVAPDRSGAATVVGMELMLCSPEWIPLADEYDRLLVEKLVGAGRSFMKELDEAPVGSALVLAAVLREPPAPVELFIDRRGERAHGSVPPVPDAGGRSWIWRPAVEPLPPLPGRRTTPATPFAAPHHPREAASPATDTTP
nr:DUF1173 family protein [Rubrivivax gelatinosus]